MAVDPHPEPPEDLPDRRLTLRAREGPWFRVHRLAHGAIYFGRARRYRFDDPAGAFGVLYVADDEAGAFVETFGHQTGARYIAAADLASSGLARINASRPLRLVDLTGPELTRLGADARLASGANYGLSQRWSRALWSHPDQPDGIYYRSRHDPSRCSLALFDRVAGVLAERQLGSFASPSLRLLLGAILDEYHYATDL